MSQRKNELLNRIFARYAHYQGASVFKVGDDAAKDELVQRSKKRNRVLESEVSSLIVDKANLVAENEHLKTINNRLRTELMKRDL